MKLIAIDMDGTLLGNDHASISERNLTALQRAKEEGHVVMICSGRARADLVGLLGRYKLSLPTGSSNGAVVYANDSLLQAAYIEKAHAKRVAQLLDETGFSYKIYTNQGIYAPTNWKTRVTAAFAARSTHLSGLQLEDIERVTEHQIESNVVRLFEEAQTLIDSNDIEVEKFFILTFHEQKRGQLLTDLKAIDEIGTTSSAPTNVEVMAKHAHKGFGLRAMAAHFGIPMENTIAIGDNFNDVPMMEAAGFSIAMGNAEQEVQDLCDAVTLSNDEDGVAHAIERYILQKTGNRG